MAAHIRLMTLPNSAPGEVRFALAWGAPAEIEDVPCASARLDFGDGHSLDLGLLCAPTAVTWREQRQAALGAHIYAGRGPYTARLRWGDAAAEALVEPARPALSAEEAAPAPVVSLFQITPVSGDPMQRLVKLRVEGLAAGQRLRLDGGAAQVRWFSDADGGTQAAEFGLTYAKPGPYTVALDLLDADGFYAATLAETPLELSAPDELAAEPRAGFSEAAPLEAAAAPATAAEPWLPYRYIRPIRSGVYTYAAPGGGAARRSVNPGIYLSVRAETTAGGERWYQTAQGDWIAASVVTFFQPSALRGVLLESIIPPTPPPTGVRSGVVTATTLNVRGRPGASADNPPIATLRAGAEVTIYEETTVAGAAWYRIGAGQWVHSAYVRIVTTPAPTPAPTPTPAPEVRRGVVTATALNVRARPGATADNPPIDVLRVGAEVSIYEAQTVAGAIWYRIGAGQWVISTWVKLVEGSLRTLAATAPATPAQLPVGWVVSDRREVRGRPGATADNPPIGTVVQHQALAILEERAVGGAVWYRIGDGQWVEATGIGVARAKPRPASIGGAERWVGVSLARQTAVAYEGDRPVFAALIASGLPGTPTVQGIFRTWLRLETGKMSGPGYYLEDVTWTCYFYSGYSLHTAYWHDKFGSPRSHGCVNMSPYDAWWVFQWSAPQGAHSPTVYVYWA